SGLLLVTLFCFIAPVHQPSILSFPRRSSSDLLPAPLSACYAALSRGTAAAEGSRVAAFLGLPFERRSLTVIAVMTHRPINKGRRSEEHTSELQSRENVVCRLLLEKKKRQEKQL